MKEYEKTIVKFAEQLLNSLGMGIGNTEDRNVQMTLKKICAGRPIYKCSNEISKFALELCQDIDDIRALKVALRACKNLPVAYRPQALKIAKRIVEIKPTASSYYDYGILLLEDRQLEEAEDIFTVAYKLAPQSYLICVHLAKTYVKLNLIDKGLELLYNFKKSSYYGKKYIDYCGVEQIDETSISYINHAISDLEDKKARGYVYRPRKKRTTN